ncbi:MAG: toll/interleukin-1 receptor domain-containing protein [Candidatus Korobacteraceae bacterium]|jgi:uncharacterized protein YjbI with pentapeptide repeats
MANPEHLKILKQGVEQWNKWRKEHPEVDPDLSGADLSMSNLSGADLGEVFGGGTFGGTLIVSKANLRGAQLSRANLWGTQLRRANLSGADLREAQLRLTDFRGAQLNGANFGKAFFSEVDLRGADLSETDFAKAFVYSTNFADVDLRTTKGLETIVLFGPSTVGIDTIYKSRGKISENFLRGCGVPDDFIAYIGAMVARPIGFDCYLISYDTLDQTVAEQLYADLQAEGVQCRFAPHEMKGGREGHEQAFRLHDKLLLILSEHSMSSEWVRTEIAQARRREVKEGTRVLFPVRLVEFEVLRDWECFDADTGKDSAREIREYFIPDFCNWKDHDSYQTAFQRLVKDLKAEASK